METVIVYENNRSDSPIEVSSKQVTEMILSNEDLSGTARHMPNRAVLVALSEFGSFDTAEIENWDEFEEETVSMLYDELF